MSTRFRAGPIRIAGGLLVLAALAAVSPAAEIKLARHPDYHDGKIVFSYRGDLWLTNDDGTNPRRLTAHRARSAHPRFSPDGQWIAFSSDRYGNADVFVMPAAGGEAKRLTYHSANDTVVGWTPDSKQILFVSARGRLYPGISNLYQVPVTGGLEQPVATDWGSWGSYSPDGKKLAFNRHPMVWWRRHYRGSYAADLWVMDVEKQAFHKVLDQETPDEQKPSNFWPMYGNAAEIFFVSDREVQAKAGTGQVMTSVNNLWKVRDDGSNPVQLTHHTDGTVFWPSLSSDGKVIVYECSFGLRKFNTDTGEDKEIHVDLAADDKDNNLETLTVNGEADAFHLSPSTKRAVISTHGELFTIPTDKGNVYRLTHTPQARETDPQWSPDGKSIAYVSDQSGRDEIWVCDERGGHARKVSDNDCQKGQITWSPDSKSLLYTGTDRKLYRLTLETRQTQALASSDVIGFAGYSIMAPRWSPDGKWVSYTKAAPITLLPHVYIVPADGGSERRVTNEDSHSDSSAVWTPDGKKLIYLGGGDVGNIGTPGRSLAQIYGVSLAHEPKDPFDKGIDDEEQAAAAEKEKPASGPGRPGSEDAARLRARRKVEVKIDWEGMERRARQLTRTADQIFGLNVTDSKSIAFTTMGTEGGQSVQSIWTLALDAERPTRVVQATRPDESEGPRGMGGGFGALQFSKDAHTLFYRQGNRLYAAAVSPQPDGTQPARGGPPQGAPRGPGSGSEGSASGGAQPLAFTCRVDVDHRAERKQVFAEAWRVMKHRFYAPDMHGVSWNEKRDLYEPLLTHVADQEELHDVVSELIGELNASHTGISPGGRPDAAGRDAGGAQTRYPGFEMTADACGYYKVAHIYKHGPADKEYVKLRPGQFILAIDAQPLRVPDNYWRMLTDPPGAKIEFTVNSQPSEQGAWRVSITPANAFQYATMQYEKWVDDRRAEVAKLSGGDVGYLHIRQMNESSLRKFERDLAELHTKKALIIDQRFNPGGNIDQELLQILQQKQYQYTRTRDSVQVTRPLAGFFGPMVVMANERSTSDAEVFPDGFRTLKLGKVVGVTTYGAVIGTGAYTLMDGSVIRTPGTGLWNVNRTNLENFGVPPDVYVDNTPEDFLKGRDAQLAKAVEVLKEELKSRQ